MTAQTAEPTWVRSIDRALIIGAGIAGVLTLLAACQVTFDVLVRTFFNQPMPGTLEIVQYLWMPPIAYAALGYVQSRGEQIRVTLLLEKATPRAQQILAIGAEAVAAAMALWLTWLAVISASRSIAAGETSPLLTWILIWPSRVAVALGMFLFLLGIVVRVYRLVHEKPGTHEEPIGGEVL